MTAKKVVFIIPGYKHQPTSKAYRAIIKLLKHEGYLPHPVRIHWRETTISENTQDFLREFRKIRAEKKYILGFSFGAMIAFLAATKVRVSGLILCSLSPYFQEDIKKAPTSWMASLTTRRYKDFVQLRCSRLAKQVKAKQTLFLYGTREEKPLIERVYNAYRHVPSRKKSVISIQEAEHNIGDRRYLQTITHIAKLLN